MPRKAVEKVTCEIIEDMKVPINGQFVSIRPLITSTGQFAIGDKVEVSYSELNTGIKIYKISVIEKTKPKPVKEFVFSAVNQISKVADFMLKQYGTFGAILGGPSGSGKTYAFRQMAEALKLEMVYVNLSTLQDGLDFFGETVLQDGSTSFELWDYVGKIADGNCLVLLDELNRTDPRTLNAIFPLMDFRGETTVKGKEIKAGERLFWGATLNEGFGYSGTFRLDRALRNRFPIMDRLTYPTVKQEINIIRFNTNCDEDTAAQVAQAILQFREIAEREGIDIDLSLRTSVNMTNMLMGGINFKDACMLTFGNFIPTDEAKSIIDQIKMMAR